MAYSMSIPIVLPNSAQYIGLTLNAQLVDTAGANSGAVITTGFSEMGLGTYQWFYGLFTTGFRGGVKFINQATSTLVAFTTVNPEDAASGADPLVNNVPGAYASGTAGAILGSLVNSQVIVSQPITNLGNIVIVQGNDYNSVDSRSIDFTSTLWPDLTAGSIKFSARPASYQVSVNSLDNIAGVLVTTGIGSQKVRVNLTSAQTGTLTPGAYDYDIQATLASGRIITLQVGTMTVKKRLSS